MKWVQKAIQASAEDQREKIEALFNKQAPNIIHWPTLWEAFNKWVITGKVPSWEMQQEKIQDLIREQVAELEEPTFVLVYNHKGKPAVNPDTMSYWEAERTKKNLEGDINGTGGNEDLENITIVNLKRIFK